MCTYLALTLALALLTIARKIVSKLKRKMPFQKSCGQYQDYCEAFHWSGCPLSLELHDSAEYQPKIKKLCTEYKKNLKEPNGSYGKDTIHILRAKYLKL